MRTVELSQGKQALVDDDDYDRVNAMTWSYWKDSRDSSQAGYAVRHPRSGVSIISMHRFICGLVDKHGNDSAPGVLVDHRNRNGLDNQKQNLRICTVAQNTQNRKANRNKRGSRFKGVFLHTTSGNWRAAIRAQNKRHNLGTYPSEEMAAVAYNRAALVHFGEFAFLNDVADIEPVRLPAHVGWRR